MRAVLQRVAEASVAVDGEIVGAIGAGLLAFIGVSHDDRRSDAEALARKMVGLRVFRDDAGSMNLAVGDLGGSILVVSQFTLYADVRKGRRPSFVGAARPEQAMPLIDALVEVVKESGVPVATGRFGAMMDVRLTNDGPVTILIETRDGSVV